jgi:hypothetical protein
VFYCSGFHFPGSREDAIAQSQPKLAVGGLSPGSAEGRITQLLVNGNPPWVDSIDCHLSHVEGEEAWINGRLTYVAFYSLE